MAKILLELRDGFLYDKYNVCLGGTVVPSNVEGFPQEQQPAKEDLVRLKSAGFTADEIIAMSKAGLL